MLILVGVTINFAINGGIINKAKEAGKQTQIAADREALLSCVIASMGLDGKVDFEELDQEILKIGFTGSNGTYTSPSGNTFTVNEDGNITSEGQSSGGGSSSANEDLAYLKAALEGKTLEEVMDDTSAMIFKDSNIIMDYVTYVSMIDAGVMEEEQDITLPILYNGKAYNMNVVNSTNDWDNSSISVVTENTANNTNQDLVYLRTFIGKPVSEFATYDETTGVITFSDSNITTTQDYNGTPTLIEDVGYMIPVSYKGNEYSVIVGAIVTDTPICLTVLEGIYEPEVATD